MSLLQTHQHYHICVIDDLFECFFYLGDCSWTFFTLWYREHFLFIGSFKSVSVILLTHVHLVMIHLVLPVHKMFLKVSTVIF